jgi:plastocyanin
MARITLYGYEEDIWDKEVFMQRFLRHLLWLVALCFLTVLVAVPTAGARGNQQAVSIQNFAFNPPNITITPGTTVTWTNNDSAPHTVTADDGSFDSETLQPGESFSLRFDSAGTFPYHCEIHPFMKGSITVSKKGRAQRGATTAKAGGATATVRGSTSEARAGGVVAIAGS